MIDNMFFLIAGLAFIFMLIGLYWESILFSAISVFSWFIASLGCFDYEIPYVYVQGNTVTETTQSVSTMHPLGWLFVILGIVMVLYIFYLAFEIVKGKEPRVL